MTDKIYDTTCTLVREQYSTEREYRMALSECNDYYCYRVRVSGGWKFFQFEDDYRTWKEQE